MDRGLYDAINIGISLADNDLIAILNCGDTYTSSNILSKCVNISRNYNYSKIIYGKMNILDDNGTIQDIYCKNISSIKYPFLRGCDVPHPTTFIHKKIYLQYGLYSTLYKVMGDYELLYRYFLRKVDFIFIDCPIINFHPAGLSKNFKYNLFQSFNIRKALKINFIINIIITFRSLFLYVVAQSLIFLKLNSILIFLKKYFRRMGL